MKRIVFIIFSTMYIVGTVCMVTHNAFALDKNGNFESKQEQDSFIAATLRKTAVELNAQTPIQIDEDTQMISVIALQKTITFFMRFSNYKAFELEPTIVSKMARENINHTVCQSKATRDLIDLGVEYIYLYKGNDGRQIARVAINSYRC
jgi:hypothetical protein